MGSCNSLRLCCGTISTLHDPSPLLLSWQHSDVCTPGLSGGGHPASERCVRVGMKLSTYGMECVADVVQRGDGGSDLVGYARERWVSEGRCRRGAGESMRAAPNGCKSGNGRRFPEKRKRSRERIVRGSGWSFPREWERSRCVTLVRPYGSAMSAESLDVSQVSSSSLVFPPLLLSMLSSSTLLWAPLSPPTESNFCFLFSTCRGVPCRG